MVNSSNIAPRTATATSSTRYLVVSMFETLFLDNKLKVTHSSIAVRAVGVRVPLYLGHS